MFVVALTGNYGMGKSSVTALFSECGACTLDSDVIVANLLEKKSVIEKIRILLGPEVLNSDQRLNKSVVADIIFHSKTARKKIEALLHPLVFQAMEAAIKKLRLRITPPLLKAPTVGSAPPLKLRGGRGSYCIKGEGCNISPPWLKPLLLVRGGDEGEGGVCGLENDHLSKRMVIVEVPLLFEGGFQKRFDRTIVVYTNQKTALTRLKKAGVSRKDALARLHAQMDIREKKRLADYVIDNNGTRQQTMAQVKKVYNALMEEKRYVKISNQGVKIEFYCLIGGKSRNGK